MRKLGVWGGATMKTIDDQVKTIDDQMKTLSDQPQSSAKLFNFDSYAQALSEIISGCTETNLVIGILGDWGSGKTSLMKTVENKIKNLFSEDDLINIKSLVKKLKDSNDPISQSLQEHFSSETKQLLDKYNDSYLEEIENSLGKKLVNDRNRLLKAPYISNENKKLIKQDYLPYTKEDLINIESLAKKLKDSNDPISQSLQEHFSSETKELLDKYNKSHLEEIKNSLKRNLVNDLNRLLEAPYIFNENKKLIKQDYLPYSKEDLIRFKRLELQEAYPTEIAISKNEYPVRTIWFNAWKYNKEDVLWRAFLMRILEELKVYARDGEGKTEYFPQSLTYKLKLLKLKIYRALKHKYNPLLLINPSPFHVPDLNNPSLAVKLWDPKNQLSQSLKERYLFSWDKIPENDNGELIQFLKQNFKINWVENANIEKIDNGKTIKVTTNDNSLSLELNNEKTRVNLRIDDNRTEEFIAKTVNVELKIYKEIAPVLKEILKDYNSFETSYEEINIKLENELNKHLNDPDLFKEEDLIHENLTENTQTLIRKKLEGKELKYLNRSLLEEIYLEEIMDKKIEYLQTSLYRDVYREDIGSLEFKPGKAIKGTIKLGLSAVPMIKETTEKLLKNVDDHNSLEDLLDSIQREKKIECIEKVQFMEQFQQRFENIIENYYYKKDKKVVIFIDDLDRCLPNKALEILEAIKLFLDVKGCIFVLGIDISVIDDIVQRKYKNRIKGRDYLEKIIQLSFNLPPLSDTEIENFIKEMDVPDFYKTKPYNNMITKGVKNNPRKIKRLINIIELQRKLAMSIQEIKKDLTDEPTKKRFIALLLEWAIISYYYEDFRKYIEKNKLNLIDIHEFILDNPDIDLSGELSGRVKPEWENRYILEMIKAYHEEYKKLPDLESIKKVIYLASVTPATMGPKTAPPSEMPEKIGRTEVIDKIKNKESLKKKNMKGADLHRLDLSRIDLSDSYLDGAKLSNAKLNSAKLIGAHMKRTILRDTEMKNADLSSAYLYEAKLCYSSLINAKMEGTTMKGAIFQICNLKNAIFDEKTDFRGANIDYVTINNLEGSDWDKAKWDPDVLAQIKKKYTKG